MGRARLAGSSDGTPQRLVAAGQTMQVQIVTVQRCEHLEQTQTAVRR